MQGRLGSVAIDTVCLFAKLDTIATYSKSAINSFCASDSDCGMSLKKMLNLYKGHMRKCTHIG